MSAIQNNEGQVPTRIVELLISNINELSKQVQSMPSQVATDISADIERLTVATTTVINKLNTPPCNEELSDKLDITIERIDTKIISEGLDAIKIVLKEDLVAKIKWMTRSVWLVTTFLGAAMLIASLIVHFNNKSIVVDLKKELAVSETIPNSINTRFGQIEELIKKLHEKDDKDAGVDRMPTKKPIVN